MYFIFCVLCSILCILYSDFVLTFRAPPESISCLALGLPFACSAYSEPECAQLVISNDNGRGAMMTIMIIIMVYDDDD